MYRNLSYNPKKQCMKIFTWSEDGQRIVADTSYRPYLYLETNGEHEAMSIFNTKLKKKSFSTQFDRLKFAKELDPSTRLFENLNVYQQFLIDMFHNEYQKPDFSKHPLKVYYLDIVYYHHCSSEKQLLEKFISYIEKDHMDVVSGWNSKLFDLPYLINRIAKICGDEDVLRLSPTNKVYSKKAFGKFGREETVWVLDGVSSVDYHDAYRKFCLIPRENYKLDTIASIELQENKIDYG